MLVNAFYLKIVNSNIIKTILINSFELNLKISQMLSLCVAFFPSWTRMTFLRNLILFSTIFMIYLNKINPCYPTRVKLELVTLAQRFPGLVYICMCYQKCFFLRWRSLYPLDYKKKWNHFCKEISFTWCLIIMFLLFIMLWMRLIYP